MLTGKVPKLVPVCISGKQGSGKTSTAQALAAILGEHFGICPYRFADPLYKMHNAVLFLAKEYGLNVPAKDGKLLQLLGTDWGRSTYGPDVWVKCAHARFKSETKMRANGLSDSIFLVDDLRFKEELELFYDSGLSFRLEASREVRKARTESWRDNDTHLSEVDLDDSLHRFDKIYKTDNDLVTTDMIAHDMAKMVISYMKGRG